MPEFRRKRNRLPEYDYSQSGAYFITICAVDRKCLFNEGDVRNLNAYGKIAEETIGTLESVYPSVHVENYVVMPNHIHMILLMDDSIELPSISRIIAQLKGIITKRAGRNLFQRSFHDHVIRDEKDYLRIWTYIDNNPDNWEKDCFYEP